MSKYEKIFCFLKFLENITMFKATTLITGFIIHEEAEHMIITAQRIGRGLVLHM